MLPARPDPGHGRRHTPRAAPWARPPAATTWSRHLFTLPYPAITLVRPRFPASSLALISGPPLWIQTLSLGLGLPRAPSAVACYPGLGCLPGVLSARSLFARSDSLSRGLGFGSWLYSLPRWRPWRTWLRIVCKCLLETPSVQDMYTRLLSANLDFDSELQHVFWWEPDECRDSRVFHVDRVFLRLC